MLPLVFNGQNKESGHGRGLTASQSSSRHEQYWLLCIAAGTDIYEIVDYGRFCGYLWQIRKRIVDRIDAGIENERGSHLDGGGKPHVGLIATRLMRDHHAS